MVSSITSVGIISRSVTGVRTILEIPAEFVGKFRRGSTIFNDRIRGVRFVSRHAKVDARKGKRMQIGLGEAK